MGEQVGIRVALVAPTLQILGGHAVQALRLLEGWRGHPDVDMRLVPINPPRSAPLAWVSRLKYARTVATQLCYWPLLLRELRRADVVHVFSASQTSFFIAPLPAILIAHLYKKPVVVNYRSGDAADHLAHSSTARAALRSVDLNVVPSSFLVGVFEMFGIRAEVIANVADLRRFRYRVTGGQRAPIEFIPSSDRPSADHGTARDPGTRAFIALTRLRAALLPSALGRRHAGPRRIILSRHV